MNLNDEINQFLLYDKVGILTLNSRGKILRVSKSAGKILSMPSFELVGSYIQDISLPLDTSFNIIFAVCKNIGIMENIPITFIKGDYRPRNTIAYIYLQKEEKDINFRFIFIDRTYENDVKNLIFRQSHELQSFIDAISDPIVSIDRDYNIIRANRECERHSNLPLDIIIGNKCYNILYNRNIKCEECLFDLIDMKTSVKIKKSLNNKIFSIIGYPLLNPDRTLSGIIEYIRPKSSDAGYDQISNASQIIPICSKCKKVENEDSQWIEIENFLINKCNIVFSHTYCNDCNIKIQKNKKSDVK